MEAVEFGEFLREMRKRKKLTIRQLDTYSGVSNSYISQMERGERGVPSPEILKKLSKPLGVSYEELMMLAGYTDSETNEDLFLNEVGELELSNDEIIKKYDLKVDGVSLSAEQVKIFVNFIRAGRMNR